MSKVLIVVFLIFGTVVGSGFSSGKEIVVYFSRFGPISYLTILLAGVLFFLTFFMFLWFGKKITKTLENSKIVQAIVLLISLVFCSSMFAGIKNLCSYFPKGLELLFLSVLPIFCIFLTMRGIKGLEKFNLVLMPLISLIFVGVLSFCMFNCSGMKVETNHFAGVFFSPLYVALNTSMSGIVIARAGQNLTKKQTLLACLFSTILLVAFLLLGNFVLLQNPESFFAQMPFLFLAKENVLVFALCFVVILAGCLTTLISLSFTIFKVLEKILPNSLISASFAVLVPFATSGLGFAQIVSFLYPICSVLGIFILFFCLFTCFGRKDSVFPANSPKNTSQMPKRKE